MDLKIIVEHVDCEENEIILRCKSIDNEMLEILSILKEQTLKLPAKRDGNVTMLTPREILYADAVDNKVFLYTNDSVYETSETLQLIEGKFINFGFLRIGKSQIVNLQHVRNLKNLLNSRVELTLNNNEKLIVSRHYAQLLKNRLGLYD